MTYAFDRKTDNIDDVMAQDVNELQAALEAHEFLTLKAATELTIASGAIVSTQAAHKLQPESGTTDDLDTISGMDTGDILILYVSDAGTDTITIKHGTGNISCSGGSDIKFSEGALICYFDGTTVYVSGGGGGGTGDGWTAINDTWTYASATTITVPSGAESIYSVGDKIKLKQTTVKYFYIVGVADTVLTVTGGSDYTVANATITSPYYSKAVTPVGFPNIFSYTPTGISASNVTITGRFSVNGRLCKVRILAVFSGAITFTTMPTLPITASDKNVFSSTIYTPTGSGGYFDASSGAIVSTIYPSVINNATTVSIKNTSNGADISESSPITWANGDAISITFDYFI